METKKPDNGSSEKQKETTEIVEEQTKKLIETHLEKVQKEIQLQIDEIEKRFQTQIEEQYGVIKKELAFITTTATKIEGMESRLQVLVEKERGEIKKELSIMNDSKQRIEEEIGDKTDKEKEMLDGKAGEAIRIAMSILTDIGDAVEAQEMTEIVHVHSDSGFYLGDAGL